MTLLALAWAYTGFAALAYAIQRHHGHGPRAGARAASRIAGGACLALSAALCIARSGWSVGPVLWLGLLTASGLALVLLLSYAPRLAWAGAILLVPAGVLALAAK